MSEWTPEIKEKLIADYLAEKPTPLTTRDIVVELADAIDKTPNGVCRILSAAGVYVAKGAVTDTEAKPARRGKADIIAELTEMLEAQGIEVDEDITSKLTGKAGQYFINVFKQVLGEG